MNLEEIEYIPDGHVVVFNRPTTTPKEIFDTSLETLLDKWSKTLLPQHGIDPHHLGYRGTTVEAKTSHDFERPKETTVFSVKKPAEKPLHIVHV